MDREVPCWKEASTFSSRRPEVLVLSVATVAFRVLVVQPPRRGSSASYCSVLSCAAGRGTTSGTGAGGGAGGTPAGPAPGGR
jgi:hypothetical protein